MSMRPSTALARLFFSSTLIPLNEEQCKILPGKNIFFDFYSIRCKNEGV